MMNPYAMLSAVTESAQPSEGDGLEDTLTQLAWQHAGFQVGAHDSWPWRPAMPWQRPPQAVPGNGGGMPPPCPLHADRAASRPVYTGTPPPGWAHTM
jgi:hypothetical protein